MDGLKGVQATDQQSSATFSGTLLEIGWNLNSLVNQGLIDLITGNEGNGMFR